jgi:hypothetical protein
VSTRPRSRSRSCSISRRYAARWQDCTNRKASRAYRVDCTVVPRAASRVATANSAACLTQDSCPSYCGAETFRQVPPTDRSEQSSPQAYIRRSTTAARVGRPSRAYASLIARLMLSKGELNADDVASMLRVNRRTLVQGVARCARSRGPHRGPLTRSLLDNPCPNDWLAPGSSNAHQDAKLCRRSADRWPFLVVSAVFE